MQVNPFFRIARPFVRFESYTYLEHYKYLLDTRYANDRFQLIRAYYNLEKDLIRLFEYIEPSDKNLGVFSFRTYELLLRSCTEFESNAKKILIANKYPHHSKKKDYNINDYLNINKATKLNDYKVIINTWSEGKKILRPFSEWPQQSSPFWYKSYNTVKHNRHEKFYEASLDNVINAVGAVFCILYSQFSILVFSQNQNATQYEEDANTKEQWSLNDGLFSIIPSQNWQDSDMYDFDWDEIKGNEPFKNFEFFK